VYGVSDALFIPEGWWHAVQSDAGSVAVNFWYSASRTDMVDSRSASYMLRVAMEAVLQQKVMECRTAAVSLAAVAVVAATDVILPEELLGLRALMCNRSLQDASVCAVSSAHTSVCAVAALVVRLCGLTSGACVCLHACQR
jgi:hypothetical protein